MAKTRKEYNERFKTVRIRVEDYNTLVQINEKSQVPIVGLIHIAIPMLKRKYRIKDEPKGE